MGPVARPTASAARVRAARRIDEQPRPAGGTREFHQGRDRISGSATCGTASNGTVAGTDRRAAHRPHRHRRIFLLLNAPDWIGHRGVGEALRDAVAELRAIDLTYGPNRPESLVSKLRRGEISPESYPPLADLVNRCAAMRAATDGWFDAWAVPGGFDPGGLLGGWAVERAAARLRAAGIHATRLTGAA